MCERQNNLAALEAGFEEVGHSGSRHSMLVPMRRWELAHHVLLRWPRLAANWLERRRWNRGSRDREGDWLRKDLARRPR